MNNETKTYNVYLPVGRVSREVIFCTDIEASSREDAVAKLKEMISNMDLEEAYQNNEFCVADGKRDEWFEVDVEEIDHNNVMAEDDESDLT
jgi:hypothetical protein